MKPEEVTYGKFKCDVILYDNGECSEGFSIAYGKYDGGKEPVIAMRWNGKNEESLGFPYMGDYKTGTPVWFVIPDMLKTTILRSIIGLPNAKSEEILKILEKIN